MSINGLPSVCPHCRSLVDGIPNIEMQGTIVLCDNGDCLKVSMCDNDQLRKLTDDEMATFIGGPGFELVQMVRANRTQDRA